MLSRADERDRNGLPHRIYVLKHIILSDSVIRRMRDNIRRKAFHFSALRELVVLKQG